MAVIENGLYSHWLFLIVSFNIWNYLNFLFYWGPSWAWSYSSWIYNYLCNQCLSLQQLWVRTLFMVMCTRYNISDKVCQWLVAGRWFSQGTPVSSTNKTDRHDILKHHKPKLNQHCFIYLEKKTLKSDRKNTVSFK